MHVSWSVQALAPLDEDSVLCTAERVVCGRVSEVFGPVVMPHYKVCLGVRLGPLSSQLVQ